MPYKTILFLLVSAILMSIYGHYPELPLAEYDSILLGIIAILSLSWTIHRHKFETKNTMEQEFETYRIYNEELNKIKEEAITANKSKSEFLANMSHELRTPMNGIISMSEILMNSKLTESQKSNTETINASANNLLSLLNDILDISKVESGELEIQEECVDLHKLLTDTHRLHKHNAATKSLTLNLKMADDTPKLIETDLARLQQVLQNLIGNAVKFTENGMVDINVTLDSIQNKLKLSVSDTGIGISEDKFDAIFNKFTQADGSVTRKFGGTGLGLAITREIITLMNGSIDLTSKEGHGSTFTVSLPYKKACDGATPVNNSTVDTINKNAKVDVSDNVRLLAVDDHPMNLICLTRLLEDIGVTHIDTAENGEEALALMSSMPYDIVFMDCMMPIMDGYEATELLRMQEEDTGEHVTVVAMTANAMVGDREKCIKQGMDDYVSKPISKQSVLTMLVKWLPESLITLKEETEETKVEEETPSVCSINTHDSDADETLYRIRESEIIFEDERLNIFTNGDEEIEQEILGIFIEQSEQAFANLKASIEQNNSEDWQQQAHKIKGSAGNIGAHQIHALAIYAEDHYESEMACKQKIFDEMALAYKELVALLKETGKVPI